ncbi:MAG TPA: hypothetical protein VLT91_07520 [Rhizomicrobium sp.]|nr:hypothetical protein [Rhizomicrobium sp.]
MSSDIAAGVAPRPSAPFAPYHKFDRNFFITYVVLIWIGVLMGFVPEMIQHVATHETPYPLIVHFHAVAFFGWLAVLTAQVLLIRTRRHDLHFRLGAAAMVLAAAMVVLGPATAIVVARAKFGTPDSDPSFLSVQLTDILSFAVLASGAFLNRGNPPAHKRLILLATLYISDAGFARWLGGGVHAMFGDGFWPTLAGLYFGNDILILGMGAYDLATRRRFHPVYLPAIAWIAISQLSAVLLYGSGFWKPVALKLIGH